MTEGEIKKKKEEGKVGGNIFIAIFAASKNKKENKRYDTATFHRTELVVAPTGLRSKR